MIPKEHLKVSVSTSWVVVIQLTHKPTGLIGCGQDSLSSRKAYNKALEDLQQQLESGCTAVCTADLKK